MSMNMREAMERALGKSIGPAPKTPSSQELLEMGEQWFQLRSSNDPDPIALTVLKQRFVAIDFRGQGLEARNRSLEDFASGLQVFNESDPRLRTVRAIRGQVRNIIPEDIFERYRSMLQRLESPAFTTGAAVFIGAVMDLTMREKDLSQLDRIVVVGSQMASTVRLRLAIPMVGEWLRVK